MDTTMWTYRESVYRPDTDLAGFDVEATDGSIGTVDPDTTNRDHLVVDTGFWIFGKKRLLPAGVVDRISYDDEKVYVTMTKDQIKDAPDHDATIDRTQPDWNRDQYVAYYSAYFA